MTVYVKDWFFEKMRDERSGVRLHNSGSEVVGETEKAYKLEVAYTTREQLTLERELTPLQEINDHYPKYILTMDIDPIADFDGIKKINVLDWLVNK